MIAQEHAVLIAPTNETPSPSVINEQDVLPRLTQSEAQTIGRFALDMALQSHINIAHVYRWDLGTLSDTITEAVEQARLQPSNDTPLETTLAQAYRKAAAPKITADFLATYPTRESLLVSQYHEQPGICKNSEPRLDLILSIAERNLSGDKHGVHFDGEEFSVPDMDVPIAALTKVPCLEDPEGWTAEVVHANVPVLLKNPTGVHSFKDNWRDFRAYAAAGDDIPENVGWGTENGLVLVDGVVFIVHPRRNGAFKIGRPIIAEKQETFRTRLQTLFDHPLQGSQAEAQLI